MFAKLPGLRARFCAIVMAVLLSSSAFAQAEGVTVFAAASLKTALDEAADSYHQATGDQIVLTYGATSALARQIEAAAPADIFIAASPDWMDYLEGGGYLHPNSRRDLFGGQLVLIATGAAQPQTAEITPDFDLMARLGDGYLATGFIDSVPAGIYAKQALTHTGFWPGVSGQVVQAENVRAAMALVALGEAPLGVVYATDALAEPRVHTLGTFPDGSHDPIIYPGAVIAETQAASPALAFLDWLAGAEGQQIFASHGFRALGP